ncbi:hypothetical protein AB6A40_006803 [Gnathostoma spinigerum]|uniref:Uncharacterized protein n=1 Tax=Gnathostoma spinigerum TaxID=75299 RepID=A0ABD6EPK2_9BILA
MFILLLTLYFSSVWRVHHAATSQDTSLPSKGNMPSYQHYQNNPAYLSNYGVLYSPFPGRSLYHRYQYPATRNNNIATGIPGIDSLFGNLRASASSFTNALNSSAIGLNQLLFGNSVLTTPLFSRNIGEWFGNPTVPTSTPYGQPQPRGPIGPTIDSIMFRRNRFEAEGCTFDPTQMRCVNYGNKCPGVCHDFPTGTLHDCRCVPFTMLYGSEQATGTPWNYPPL